MERAQRRRRWVWLGLGVCGLALFAASALSQFPPCGGYTDWHASDYVLPYPAGAAYAVYQGNCTLGGHRGVYRYSYDFLMPVGSIVTAARAGVVADTFANDPADLSWENWVAVQHADGTYAYYSHLLRPLVARGAVVAAGDPLGLSGNSGRTGGVPHLHFSLSRCPDVLNCGTLPVTFRNTAPHPGGLRQGQTYVAGPP